jgi:parallel beta-helix repeat protein
VLGTPADSFADPGPGVRTSGNQIQAPSPPAAANGTIRENLIGFGAATSVAPYGAGWTIRNNEIRFNARENTNDDGIAMHGGAGTATIVENMIAGQAGFGIDLMANSGGNTIVNNTITGNGHGNGTPTQRAGIRLMGSGSTIERNVITGQNGAAIHVVGTDAANPAYTPALRNTLTRNVYGGNGAIAIDLLAAGANHQSGDGVTLNDGALNPTTGNDGLDYPVVTSAVLAAGTLRVQGTVTAGARVELYESDGDASGHGEGVAYLAGLVEGSGSDADPAAGAFDFSFAAPGVALGDAITSIALLEPDPGGFPGQYDTSEFDVNTTVVTDLEIFKRAFTLDGTPIASGTTLPAGLSFQYLLYVNNRNAARDDVSVRDVLDPAFAYEPGTLRVSNAVAACADATCTPVEEAAIRADVAAAAPLTDAADGDVASYSAGTRTIDAGDEHAANARLDIAAARVWALIFTVRMQ